MDIRVNQRTDERDNRRIKKLIGKFIDTLTQRFVDSLIDWRADRVNQRSNESTNQSENHGLHQRGVDSIQECMYQSPIDFWVSVEEVGVIFQIYHIIAPPNFTDSPVVLNAAATFFARFTIL